MSSLFMQAYWMLIHFDFYLTRDDFPALYERVRECPMSKRTSPLETIEPVCSAVNTACIWYWKEVLCLQRSAATTCLLRRFGVPAQMVIGAQRIPFRAHAWVEVDGRVVNDKPYAPEKYAVLDRC